MADLAGVTMLAAFLLPGDVLLLEADELVVIVTAVRKAGIVTSADWLCVATSGSPACGVSVFALGCTVTRLPAPEVSR